MKIALVVHDLHERGGHSLYTRMLADEFSRHHQVVVFANRCDRPVDALWSFQPVRAWRFSALTTVRTFPFGLRSLASRLAEFDVCHMQGYCGGNPNVVTAHICVAAYLHSLRDISMRNRASLSLMAKAESHFYRHYSGRVIAVSQKIARELREFYQVRSEISVVPHGVDAERFCYEGRELDRQAVRSEIGLGTEQTMALYVGDLTKSHTHLKALAASVPEIQLVIVTSSQRYRWTAPNVHILPPTSRLERYYAAADALVFPTCYDAFGMVVLEAMASGLAVFCSNRAGASELIRSGKNGFVYSLEEWVEATRVGLCDRDSLRMIGREAERTARKHDWSAVVAAVEDLYREVATVGRPVTLIEPKVIHTRLQPGE
jgi:UDP-glucose:(heptosyl)LPS alpha-1,3-glucosyltransferase